MRESSLDILEQYDLEISGIKKTRGAILCDTDQGVFLLKEVRFSECRMQTVNKMQEHLVSQGYDTIDNIYKNKEGELVTKAEDGSSYILKKWFSGKECDVKKEKEVLQAVRELARLHLFMRMPHEKELWDKFHGNDLQDIYVRHNKEFRKIRTFIRKKPVKGMFEDEVLKNFETIYAAAEETTDYLENFVYQELYQKSIEQGRIVHGEYNYHNVIFLQRGVAVTNFEHCCLNIQAEDLYYFMRKVMEKYRWNIRLGKEMIAAYRQICPLEKEDLDYIAIRFLYPEKIWKIVNMYYHSNKAWIPSKNIEKLKISVDQMAEKRRFVKAIFSFHL